MRPTSTPAPSPTSPEGYELVWTGDLQINDGWVWVEVRPTKTLRIFWAIDNGEQAGFADGSEDIL